MSAGRACTGLMPALTVGTRRGHPIMTARALFALCGTDFVRVPGFFCASLAVLAVPSEPCLACTAIAANGVGAGRVCMAVVVVLSTFVHVHAVLTFPCETCLACTAVAASSIVASRVSVTIVIVIIGALVYVCKKKNAFVEEKNN